MKLFDKQEEARIQRWSKLVLSGMTCVYAVLVLILQGILISLPFLVLAMYMFARKWD